MARPRLVPSPIWKASETARWGMTEEKEVYQIQKGFIVKYEGEIKIEREVYDDSPMPHIDASNPLYAICEENKVLLYLRELESRRRRIPSTEDKLRAELDILRGVIEQTKNGRRLCVDVWNWDDFCEFLKRPLARKMIGRGF